MWGAGEVGVGCAGEVGVGCAGEVGVGCSYLRRTTDPLHVHNRMCRESVVGCGSGSMVGCGSGSMVGCGSGSMVGCGSGSMVGCGSGSLVGCGSGSMVCIVSVSDQSSPFSLVVGIGMPGSASLHQEVSLQCSGEKCISCSACERSSRYSPTPCNGERGIPFKYMHCHLTHFHGRPHQ